MEQTMTKALEALQRNTGHRVAIYDEWHKDTTKWFIDQIKLEASSGSIKGYSGGALVFELTPAQFSELDRTGHTEQTYWIDHCPIHKRINKID